jgi:hypothetical protein
MITPANREIALFFSQYAHSDTICNELPPLIMVLPNGESEVRGDEAEP